MSDYTIDPLEYAAYLATARRRAAKEQQALEERREQDWEVARQAAVMLRERFGATKVAVIGSLAHGHWFSMTSDVDLAVWGLAADNYFTAVARLQDLSPQFGVDLIDAERCRQALKQAVMKEGIPI